MGPRNLAGPRRWYAPGRLYSTHARSYCRRTVLLPRGARAYESCSERVDGRPASPAPGGHGTESGSLLQVSDRDICLNDIARWWGLIIWPATD